jgi:NitT/TauT family transport system permease protein
MSTPRESGSSAVLDRAAVAVGVRRSDPARTRLRLKVLFWQILLLVVTVGAWEFGARHKYIDPFFYSTPSAVARQFGEWFSGSQIWWHIYVTLKETFLGYAVGAGLAIACGFALGYGRMLSLVLNPFVGMFNGVPKVVLAPLFILWFGISTQSKVALAASIVFFIVFYAVYSGVRNVDTDLLERARVLGASDWQIFTSVLVPSTMTWIFSSLRVSIGLALGGAVVGEYMAANEGLGYLIATASASFQGTTVMAGIALLMVITNAMNYLLEITEQRFEAWRT